ncbi:MAG: hypothetical protein Q4B09_01050 [Lachnospiraceae bacterium]|nr:hypothetical protein [Lachnospiraceae bacterium]
MVKVIIKFISRHTAENVISALAMDPELLVLVGYGNFLTESMRNRLNYFFHHRKLQTVLADPVRLERFLEADIETKLAELLEKYEDKTPVLDITHADAEEGLALGTVLRAHKAWRFPILDSNIRESVFLPQKNAEILRRLSFPSLTAAELSFLRTGSPVQTTAGAEGAERQIGRRDLDRTAVRMIRRLGRLYEENPSYWKEVSACFRKSGIAPEEGRLEYTLDAAELPVRDDTMEDLVDEEILTQYVRRGGILRFVFADENAAAFLLHIEKIPILNIFLIAAFIREYGRAAAYHDLVVRNDRYVTGIRHCLPVAIAIPDPEEEPASALCRFKAEISELFDDPVRMIMICESEAGLSGKLRRTAQMLGIEFAEKKKLAELLEPK